MSDGILKPRFTWKDAIYLAVLAISLGVTISKFSERVTLLEKTVTDIEDERKLYNVAVIANDIQTIKEDVGEIKELVKELE